MGRRRFSLATHGRETDRPGRKVSGADLTAAGLAGTSTTSAAGRADPQQERDVAVAGTVHDGAHSSVDPLLTKKVRGPGPIRPLNCAFSGSLAFTRAQDCSTSSRADGTTFLLAGTPRRGAVCLPFLRRPLVTNCGDRGRGAVRALPPGHTQAGKGCPPGCTFCAGLGKRSPWATGQVRLPARKAPWLQPLDAGSESR